jgi:hypothetical protein
MTATRTGNGGEHQGRDGTGAARLSTLTRLAFLGGPMLSMIDSSVVNIAVPDIVTDLHTSLATAARLRAAADRRVRGRRAGRAHAPRPRPPGAAHRQVIVRRWGEGRQ